MNSPIALGTIPKVCFPLLEALEQDRPQQAARIADTFSFVLEGIKDDAVQDWEMVGWLFEAIAEEFTEVAPAGLRFGRRGSRWDFWPDDCASS